jgi:hypothetical protein
VDREERARWPIEQSLSGRIEIAPDDRLVEIYGVRDGENMRLAAYMLSYDLDDQLRPLAATLTLEGGQELRLDVEPLSGAGEPAADEEDVGAAVSVRYRETAPLRALLLWLRSLRFSTPARRLTWKSALAFMSLALASAAIGYWFWIRREAPGEKLTRGVTPTARILIPTPPNTATSPQPRPSSTPIPASSAPPPSSSDEVIAMDIRRRAGEPGETLTRGERTAATGLLEVKKVYLQISGARREDVRQQLLQRLPADNNLSLTDNPGEADVALKVTVAAAPRDRLTLTAQIADANGNVIWPLTPGVIERKYEGSLEKVIVTFSRQLAADLRRLERQK